MALGGVDTGIINPNDDDRAIPMATGIGLISNDRAAPMAIGAIRLVDAVCDVNSDIIRVVTQNTPTKAHSDGSSPKTSLIPLPIHADSPVVYIIAPMAKPPPKSSSVPHSMPSTPSFQLSAVSPFFPGRKNSNSPPTMAAMDSGKWLS